MLLAPSPSSPPFRARRPAVDSSSSSPHPRPAPSAPPPASNSGAATAAAAAVVLRLPDDVLARCLAYLPSPLELAAAGAACRAWRGVARGDDLWWPFVARAWPSLRRFLPPWALATSSSSNSSSGGSTQHAPNRSGPAPPVIRGPLCRLFALRLPPEPGEEEEEGDEGEEEDEEAAAGGHRVGGYASSTSSSSSSSSDDDDDDYDDGSSKGAGRRRKTARVSLGHAAPTAAAHTSGAAAQAGSQQQQQQQQQQQRLRRQLQVPLRAEDVVLHIELRDLEGDDDDDDDDDDEGGDDGGGGSSLSWRRRLRVGRPLYSAAFCLADPRAFWLAVYSASHYRPRTLPGAVVDVRRLAALLSDNLDELGSPLLKLDVAAIHLPTGAVLRLPWRHSTLQLVQSFSLEEAEPNNLHGGDDDDEDSNAIRLILDGGTRGPTTTNSGTLQQRLDLSFCPAIDLNPLPAGDPARPRPARLRTAPVEVRIYDLPTEEYLDEAGLDRRQACGALLRFLAAVGDGGGWRA